jgi:predicted metal-dependent hydrolase
MPAEIMLGDIPVDVVLKSIKNIHLSVYPPQGRVRIAAPLRMDLDTIRVFAISKLGWIKAQQRKLRSQPRESPRVYLDRESHLVWGRRYLLKVVERDAPPAVTLRHSTMVLQLRPGTSAEKRQSVLDEWYRDQLKVEAQGFIAKWAAHMNIPPPSLSTRKMKTKWGSCTPGARSILLNLELAKKPPVCLEYIVVHELVHLLEPTHGANFVALMNGLMPKWRFHRDELNRLPVKHEDWMY